ncbi:phosphoadenylyl-sulfate reductase [Corynebacterium crudilactis]|uniref:Adenosine 5'-phosphosulfate reductase n=1 Tax=Corynebacterium crudilactis TaxID=1652495 RepID=A0A172QW67_9CORY|nr:phosphoadenylyl-sulfate reductase [Corynebacterium crudilactis]ANE04963.1 phosphoadenosine phosphosulfate reductase [Corynebacterium crudilactis]
MSFQVVNALKNTGSIKDPEVSPEGPRSTEPLSLEVAQRNEELVEKHAAALYDASAQEILEWTAEHAPGAIAVTLSMENTVLAELASRHLPEADFLFLDTGYHFKETLEVARDVDARYSQTLVTALPILKRTEQDSIYGLNLYRNNPTACCRMRKVEPLAASLSPYSGWITGLRRDDGPTRAQAPALSLDATGRLKISPIITWSLEETNQFIVDNNLIDHPLTHQGYPSIGCETCTLPVAEGQDPRAGRWAGNAKTECGLHS